MRGLDDFGLYIPLISIYLITRSLTYGAFFASIKPEVYTFYVKIVNFCLKKNIINIKIRHGRVLTYSYSLYSIKQIIHLQKS